MTFRKNEPRCDEPSEMTEAEQRLFIMTKLSNPWWRLNHLYKIQNEKGELVTFRMRPAQRQLFRSMHNKNIILKARQLGFSTAIDIYLLDQALFIPHLKCGIVAQDKQAASEIFRTKIAVPFDHLPDWLRASFTIVERRSGASGGYILFGHGSSTAHKPVTEYGSAHPDDQTVLAIPVDKAIAQVRDRSKFAEISKNYGYFMPKQQGLSLKELQKGASNVAADAIKNGGNAQAAVDEYYAATGSQPHQQKIQQQKLQQQVINWAGDDPDKLSFARNVAARQPEMLEPQNQKLLENGYANFLRIQKARGEQARDESASSASQFIRGLKQNYAQ